MGTKKSKPPHFLVCDFNLGSSAAGSCSSSPKLSPNKGCEACPTGCPATAFCADACGGGKQRELNTSPHSYSISPLAENLLQKPEAPADLGDYINPCALDSLWGQLPL